MVTFHAWCGEKLQKHNREWELQKQERERCHPVPTFRKLASKSQGNLQISEGETSAISEENGSRSAIINQKSEQTSDQSVDIHVTKKYQQDIPPQKRQVNLQGLFRKQAHPNHLLNLLRLPYLRSKDKKVQNQPIPEK